MAELISCAKNTQLHSFPELELLSTSAHVDSNASSDCQFFGSSKLFVRANKNRGIELLRIKNSEQPTDDGAGGCPGSSRTIASVRKMMVDNLYCVACPKSVGRDEIAIGLTSGSIRFMNYKKANFTKRFNADGIAIGVTFLDFNANDQLLAAVYENGLINLYGMKTSVKCQTIPFDKNTIKARFHPTKRSMLAMASYNGAIVQYDTQTKKPVFSQPTAHSAPCRDLAMVETYPDYLFSVGYDCVINIFDVRCKQPASQVQSNYPFESLAIANDGHRFAVGNLKGYVYGYDLRSLRDPLNMQKLHQSNVNSLAFVPQPQKDGSGRRSMFELEETGCASATKVAVRGGRVSEGSIHVAEEKKNVGKNDHVSEQRDSFMGEIDMFLQRRDSPLDCMSRLSTSSRLSTESRNSMQMGDNNLVGLLDDLSDCNVDVMEGKANDSGEKSLQSSLNIDDSFVNIDRLVKRTKVESSGRGINGSGDLQRLHRTAVNSRMGENLEYIREEGSEMVESDCEAGVTRSSDNSSAGNRVSSNRSSITSVTSNNSTQKATTSAANRVLVESQQGNLVSKPSSLTHGGVTSEASQSDKENQARHLQLVSMNDDPHLPASHPSPLVDRAPATGDGNQIKPAHHRPDPEFASPGVRTEVEELRRIMLEQFQLSSLQHQDSERELRSYLWMGMFNLWRETQGKLESLEQTVSTGLGMLLAKDEFSQQFIATRAENETLKNRVRELEEKLQQFATSSLKR
ncbi:uncharacterized protein LOC126571742 [Anopheles aquasalis]|uniref:uncharacterized protein LOC126571742 n=1 Tax=Anopheles aquasalis TaxID=42839 RepID=UPI00215AEEE6|nr:uncharacterized protein LOC126571742 [Anopheles aquasalis]